MKATNSGRLAPVEKAWISIPGAGTIVMNNLPDVSDSKSAVYNNESIMGRSFPLYTYANSGDRAINIQLHFFITEKGEGERNLQYLRWIESATYPQRSESGVIPFSPPSVCSIRIGDLLAREPICAVLQSYSVKFPTEVAWDLETYCPYRFDVDTSWLVVYTSSELPYADRIVSSGR